MYDSPFATRAALGSQLITMGHEMKNRYQVFRRGWVTYRREDVVTKKQTTLGSRDKDEAYRLTAAMFGFKCVIYMGAVDCERQVLNVYRMKMLGAEALNEAMRD